MSEIQTRDGGCHGAILTDVQKQAEDKAIHIHLVLHEVFRPIRHAVCHLSIVRIFGKEN
jgi:hypothetical protein